MISGFFVPITFLPDHAKDSGLTPEQSVVLISVLSVANSVSRVLIGWVADQPWSNTVLIRNGTFIIVGTITCFVPYFKNFALLVIYSATVGSTIGRSETDKNVVCARVVIIMHSEF